MTPTITLRKALTDPALLGSTPLPQPWFVLLLAFMGEALTEKEHVVFTQITGREQELGVRGEELVGVIGRRGRKSSTQGAKLVPYIACLCDHSDVLAPGEKGIVLCIAPDQRQASIVLEYASAAIEGSPILRQLIANRTTDSIELTNNISIEVRAASFRRLRGPTYVAVIADEAAFWYSDEFSSNTDAEILNAVRPGLATTQGPLVIISSPYARRGILWEAYKRHYGPTGDPRILVVQGSSTRFNPDLPDAVVDRALERDRASAAAEYLAMFRADIESFVPIEVVESCLGDHHELLPDPKQRYQAFVDPSGGSSDSFTLAVAHREDKRIVIDALREVRPPFSPERVIEDFANLLKGYRVTLVRGDKYAGEFPRELFRKHGIAYRTADKSKSDLYRDILPLLNSGSIVLPRSDRLVAQVVGLERRTTRAGRDSIDHAPNNRDDLANAVAGAADVVGSLHRATGHAVASWDGRVYWTSEKGFLKENNITNPQSAPDSADHVEPEPLDEKWFKRIPTLRIW